MIISNLKAIEKRLINLSKKYDDADLKHVIKIIHDLLKCMEQFKRDFGRWL
jgi:hypothetical protein